MVTILSEETEHRIRSPIGVILGHVDSGKTSLLDRVRGTAVQAREAGGITQHVGASFFPMETIMNVCGPLMKASKMEMKIPGVLIVDTPGHAAFMNLRSRGASVADIAILVVDIFRGFQAQTYESIEILSQRKVPFIIAANKIDRMAGWKSEENRPFVLGYGKQTPRIRGEFDLKIFEIMGEMSELGFKTDRYDHIKDFRKNIAIIPTSAVTGEGIQDLFLMLVGLAQQFLMQKLDYAVGLGRGSVLEVKEEEGLGTTLDVILHQGTLSKKNGIVVGGRNGPIYAKIRALLQPKPLDEMRDPKDKFTAVQKLYASAGIKISAPGIDDTFAGSSLIVVDDSTRAEAEEEIRQELGEIRVDTEDLGIVLKADTLGTLEALIDMLRQKGIPIKRADVGPVAKRDVADARIIADKDEAYGAILAFNMPIDADVEEEVYLRGVKLFENKIIYGLVDEYESFMRDTQEKAKSARLADLVRPAQIDMIPGMVFRKNKPAVFGVTVVAGRIKPRSVLISLDNVRLGTIQQIQLNKETVQEAKMGDEVAISIRGPTIGRQITEGMTMLVDMSENTARMLCQKYKGDLTAAEITALDTLCALKRKHVHKFWAW